MKPKRLLTRLAPALVFALGVAAGIGVSVLFVSKHLKDFVENGPGAAVHFGTAAFADELDLTAAQRAQFAPLAERIEKAFRDMHREDLARVRILFEDVATELRPHLTPEQSRRLDELLVDPRRRWEKHLGADPPPTAP